VSARRFEAPAVDWTRDGFRFGAPSPKQLEFFGAVESRKFFDEAVAAFGKRRCLGNHASRRLAQLSVQALTAHMAPH